MCQLFLLNLIQIFVCLFQAVLFILYWLSSLDDPVLFVFSISSLSFRYVCFVIVFLSWPSVMSLPIFPGCPGLAVLSDSFQAVCSCFCSFYPLVFSFRSSCTVLLDLFWVPCYSFRVRCSVLAVLLQQSCSGRPVPAVLFRLSCLGYPDLAALLLLSCSGYPVPAVLFWLSCSGCPVLAVLIWMSYSYCHALTVLSYCLVLTVLFWPSFSDWPALSALFF
jgi:hypothetical protein